MADMAAGANDELGCQVRAVLLAKTGRVHEAMALFDALPGRLRGYHPAAIVLSTAEEMIEQCNLAYTMALIGRLAEDYPEHLLVRGLTLRCHLFAGQFSGRASSLACRNRDPNLRPGLPALSE